MAASRGPKKIEEIFKNQKFYEHCISQFKPFTVGFKILDAHHSEIQKYENFKFSSRWSFVQIFKN